MEELYEACEHVMNASKFAGNVLYGSESLEYALRHQVPHIKLRLKRALEMLEEAEKNQSSPHGA